MRSEEEIKSEGIALLTRMDALQNDNPVACGKYLERLTALTWVLGRGASLLLTEEHEKQLEALS